MPPKKRNRIELDIIFTPDKICRENLSNILSPNNNQQSIVENIFTPDRTNTNLAKQKLENVFTPNNNRVNREAILESINVPKKNALMSLKKMIRPKALGYNFASKIFENRTKTNLNCLINLIDQTKEVIHLLKYVHYK